MRLAQLSTNKRLLATVASVAAVAVVGTTIGYQSLTSQVSLSLDGKTEQVTAMGSTVGDVLDAQGIEVTDRDLVLPALDSEVRDGTEIAVRFARPVALTVDGDSSTHWVTATDVDTALDEIGRRYSGADLSVSRSSSIDRDGIDLEVVTPKKVSVKVGAKKAKNLEMTVLTVGDVLRELGVEVDEDDELRPSADTPLAEGEKVVVTRVKVVTRQVEGEEIPFRTTETPDETMMSGERTTTTEGRTGLRDVTYEVTYRNGKVVARKVVTADVTRKARNAVVKVGTGTNLAAGNTVWDALAKCESGGNWATNTGNGYYGGLQFSASTWRAVGGSGLPHQHSREEQIKRGKILQARSGWGQWPHCSSKLGLR